MNIPQSRRRIGMACQPVGVSPAKPGGCHFGRLWPPGVWECHLRAMLRVACGHQGPVEALCAMRGNSRNILRLCRFVRCWECTVLINLKQCFTYTYPCPCNWLSRAVLVFLGKTFVIRPLPGCSRSACGALLVLLKELRRNHFPRCLLHEHHPANANLLSESLRSINARKKAGDPV